MNRIIAICALAAFAVPASPASAQDVSSAHGGVKVETLVIETRIPAYDDSFRDDLEDQMDERPRDPVPRTNPGSWIGSDGYPSDAMREGVEGATGFRLTVGKSGTAIDCEVTSSSGSASLDEATCTNLMRRARFAPALDADGNPVEGEYESTVRWVLPANSLPPAMSFAQYIVVDETGTVVECGTLEEPTGDFPTPPNGFCESMGAQDYEVSFDEDGNPVSKRVVFRMSITHEPVE